MTSTPPRDESVALSLADDAGLGLIRFGGDLTVTLANRAAHTILARRPRSLAGRTLMEAFLDHRLESLVRRAAQGTVGRFQIESGDHRSVLVRARAASGGGAWVTLEDVTELKRLRRIRSEFIENLSHELRTPLASIRLLTEMLLDDLETTEVSMRIRERVATIDVETGHLVQMVTELLDLSRIEQASSQVRHDEVLLAPLVEASLQRLRTFAERQRVVLVELVPDDLPQLRGDEERLEQLLMILLHNAIKFSPDGGSVIVTTEEHADRVVISVTDHGVGIPSKDQDRVFERFYKVDRARHRGLGGSGLGLAIARHIAEAHGGRIWLDSTEGKGSTFSFSIPLAQPALRKPAAPVAGASATRPRHLPGESPGRP